jgi:hypothetical protein
VYVYLDILRKCGWINCCLEDELAEEELELKRKVRLFLEQNGGRAGIK